MGRYFAKPARIEIGDGLLDQGQPADLKTQTFPTALVLNSEDHPGNTVTRCSTALRHPILKKAKAEYEKLQ